MYATDDENGASVHSVINEYLVIARCPVVSWIVGKKVTGKKVTDKK